MQNSIISELKESIEVKNRVIKELVNLPLVIPSQNTPRIQEAHITSGHIICTLVEKVLFT